VSNDTDNTRNEARKPVIYNGDLQALPQAQGLRALTSLEIWALWRAIPKTDKAGNTKVTKPPFQPSGSYANPAEASTFSSLEDCLAAMAARPGHYDGVGVRVPDDVCALDLDGVMEENRPDTLNPWVRALIDRLRCYCEITPSGRGVRIFIGYSGEKLPRTKFKIPDGEGNIEVYCRANHFVTITNNPFPDTLPRIADRTDEIQKVYAELDKKQPVGKSAEVIDFPAGPRRRGRPTRAQAAENRLERTIKEGRYEDFGGDRSAAVHYVACEMVRRGRSDDEIIAVLTEPTNRISEHVREHAAGEQTQARREAEKARRKVGEARQVVEGALAEFVHYRPKNDFIYAPMGSSGEHWPAPSVDAHVNRAGIVTDEFGTAVRPSTWLMQNRAVQAITWAPGHPRVIADKLVTRNGWKDHPGASMWNLYDPPLIHPTEGDPTPWLDQVRRLYPDGFNRIIQFFAHRVQRPGEKPNFGLVLGGLPGIGKDTIIGPLVRVVGGNNFKDASPRNFLDQWTHYVQAVVLRINEAADLGELDRFKLYERLKTILAAPPDTLEINEKYKGHYTIPNLVGVIITTNHRTSGLYLPADDRRHEVYWSEYVVAEADKDAEIERLKALWRWYESGGYEIVAHYLANVDLTDYSAKEPPPKTSYFWEMVAMGTPSLNSDIDDVVESLGKPDVVTVGILIAAAVQGWPELAEWLKDEAKNARAIRHRIEEAGYIFVKNPDHAKGRWKIKGRSVAVYGRSDLNANQRLAAAQEFQRQEGRAKETSGAPPLPF
jgi:hypothetical protein